MGHITHLRNQFKSIKHICTKLSHLHPRTLCVNRLKLAPWFWRRFLILSMYFPYFLIQGFKCPFCPKIGHFIGPILVKNRENFIIYRDIIGMFPSILLLSSKYSIRINIFLCGKNRDAYQCFFFFFFYNV